MSVVAWRELGVRGHDPQLLLPGQGLLALHVPAVGELPAVLVDPLLGDVVRGVGRAGRVVDEERPVRHQRLLLADPADRAVREVLGEVVALLGRRRRLDRRGAVVERRLVLVVLAADEAVEGLEPAATGRPGVERTHRRGLPDRHLVALAELRRRVAVELERHRQRSLGVGTHRALAGRGRRGLGDAAHRHRVVVATRQQRLARGRAQGRRVEAVEPQPAGRQALRGGRVAGTAEGAGGAEPDVVEQDHQDVRGALRREQRLDGRESWCPGPWRRTSSARSPGGRGSAAWCGRDGRSSSVSSPRALLRASWCGMSSLRVHHAMWAAHLSPCG